MLRVASRAVIIVEPQDPFIDLPLVRGVRVPSYDQDDNNFVYGISFAELTKVGYATNMPAVSYKTFNDFYKPGLEFSVARDGDKEFDMLKEVINQLNLRVAQGLSKNNMAMAILWNRVPTSHELEKLARHGWLTTNTNTNPYVNRENSYSAHFKLGYDAEGQIVLSESYSGD